MPTPMTEADADRLKDLRNAANHRGTFLHRQHAKAVNTGEDVFQSREYQHALANLKKLVAEIAGIKLKYR